MEAGKEFMKGKDVFHTVPHIVVVVSPLKALVLDQVTCKHLVHTGPGMSCILACPTSLHHRSKAAVALSELEHSIGSCNR